ncbi:hypothetical protein ACHAWF_010565 [Thalassiosira exigua]
MELEHRIRWKSQAGLQCTHSNKRQKKGKPNDASTADEAAGFVSPTNIPKSGVSDAIVAREGAGIDGDGAELAARSVSPAAVPRNNAKTVAVKKEESETEDLNAETDNEVGGAEPVYVTYEDFRPLYNKVKGKSSSANEKEFCGHIKGFLEEKGRHLRVSEFNLIQELMGKFESLVQDQAQSVDEGDAKVCESFLVGIIEQCKRKLPL